MLDLSKIKRPGDLPQWRSPPLDEVAISIQFNDIAGFRTVHYGQLAERLREYGLTLHEDKGIINTAFEVFGKRAAQPSFKIQIQQVEAPLPRVWYMSGDKHKLAQVQPDRFVYNWRKVEGAGVYPRLNTVLPEFWKTCECFQKFLADQSLAPLVLNQCELSYFNNIEVHEEESYENAFSRVFRLWRGGVVPSALKRGYLEPDAGNFSSAYVLKSNDGTPLARVHAQAIASLRKTGRFIRFQLVFRGPWSGQIDMALMEFFAQGREAIVRLFDSMITDQMHAEWGRHLDQE